jgi:alpha-tubulin suppressor-like RCC1 family protein
LESLVPDDHLGGAVAIAASNAGAAALKIDGTVWTWGFNSNGQLGDGTLVNRPFAAPVEISGGALIDVTNISGGTFFFLAARSDGTAWGWGQNANGQLGDGTTADRQLAVQVVQPGGGYLSEVAQIAAGGSHAHALMADGTMRSWGFKGVGQLGNGTTTPVESLATLVPLTDVDKLFSGGGLSGALLLGTGRTWGANAFGQIGDGSTENRLTPVPVAALNGATAAATSGAHVLALRQDGTVVGWGLGTSGQLGHGVGIGGSPVSSLTPVAVTGLGEVISVSAAGNRSMALTTDGTVWGWGFNSTGQLGDGTTANRLIPVQVKNILGDILINILAISAGGSFSLAVASGGSVWAWGQNSSGQIGDGTAVAARLLAVQVMTATGPLTGATGIAAGGSHSLALLADGSVWSWGGNTFGQLGDGTTNDRRTAIQVGGLDGIVAIAAGGAFSLALKSDGTVWAWGLNIQGQLGDGTTTNRLTPTRVMKTPTDVLGAIAEVAAGGAHGLARSVDGVAVWAWGAGDSGQLGNGLDPNATVPITLNFPDIDPPIITVSGVLTVDAASSSGAVVTFSATAEDDTEGSGPVICDHASAEIFPIGITTVVCLATDHAGNTASKEFVVTVRDVTTPGKMEGVGLLVTGRARGIFAFQVVERPLQQGHLSVVVVGGGSSRSGVFLSQAVTFVAFSDNASYEPGMPVTSIDTVRLSGTGKWNGIAGHRFDMLTTDRGEPGRLGDTTWITISGPSGTVVAHLEGTLREGNIQSVPVNP